MRILQVITRSELGGAQSVVINLANNLCQEHEVIVVAGEGDGKMWKVLDNRVKKVECPTLQRALSPIKDIRTIFSLKKIYKQYQPDIIHLHSSKAGMLGRMAFPKKKIVYTVHGFDSIRVAFRKLLPIERMMQSKCASIIGVSYYDTKNLRTEGITKGLSTVYNGIQLPVKDNDVEVKIPAHYKKKILCIARVAKPKRVDIFMDVAKLLPEYAFMWIGNQKEMDCDLPNVFFMGNITNASRYNVVADLFMLSSDYEGLPMTIIEAISYGKPVVASNVGGIAEIICNGENGFVVENTATAFADKIKLLLTNDQLYTEYSRQSIKRFKDYFTVEKMTNAYMEVYQEILCGKS